MTDDSRGDLIWSSKSEMQLCSHMGVFGTVTIARSLSGPEQGPSGGLKKSRGTAPTMRRQKRGLPAPDGASA
jgi:hypothetical protein